MSLPAINWALRDPHVQRTVFGPARAVLFVLADHANAAGEAWPSMFTLVSESGHANGTVANALGTLERLGVITSLGYRQRSRLRRLNLVTSPPPGDVATSPPPGQVAPTSPPPGQIPVHDLSTTSPAPGDEPEPEPTEQPPFPPEGERQRDRQRFEAKCAAYAQRHLPDTPDGTAAVRQAVTYGNAKTLAEVRAFAAEHFPSADADAGRPA